MPRQARSRTPRNPSDDGQPVSPESPVSKTAMELRLEAQEKRAADPNAKSMREILFEQGTKPII